MAAIVGSSSVAQTLFFLEKGVWKLVHAFNGFLTFTHEFSPSEIYSWSLSVFQAPNTEWQVVGVSR